MSDAKTRSAAHEGALTKERLSTQALKDQDEKLHAQIKSSQAAMEKASPTDTNTLQQTIDNLQRTIDALQQKDHHSYYEALLDQKDSAHAAELAAVQAQLSKLQKEYDSLTRGTSVHPPASRPHSPQIPIRK